MLDSIRTALLGIIGLVLHNYYLTQWFPHYIKFNVIHILFSIFTYVHMNVNKNSLRYFPHKKKKEKKFQVTHTQYMVLEIHLSFPFNKNIALLTRKSIIRPVIPPLHRSQSESTHVPVQSWSQVVFFSQAMPTYVRTQSYWEKGKGMRGR